jgi:hypothetical protein
LAVSVTFTVTSRFTARGFIRPRGPIGSYPGNCGSCTRRSNASWSKLSRPADRASATIGMRTTLPAGSRLDIASMADRAGPAVDAGRVSNDWSWPGGAPSSVRSASLRRAPPGDGPNGVRSCRRHWQTSCQWHPVISGPCAGGVSDVDRLFTRIAVGDRSYPSRARPLAN